MKASSIDEHSLEEQSVIIANEIFSLINQYTNDSGVSKFFLSDEIARACYGLAGGFASMIYAPNLEPEEIADTAIFSFVYALMTYGFNIYLKEHSLTTNSAPYKLPRDKAYVKKVQKKVLNMTSENSLFSTPLAEKIIHILLENVKTQLKTEEFRIKNHRMNKARFEAYVKLSLYWGYNFALQLMKEPD